MPNFKVKFQPKYLNHTFIEISKKNDWVKEGNLYTILDWTNNDRFLKKAILVQSRVITQEDLTSELSFLDMNCSLSIYKQIMQMNSFDEDQLLSVLTFSETPIH